MPESISKVSEKLFVLFGIKARDSKSVVGSLVSFSFPINYFMEYKINYALDFGKLS